MQHLSVAFVPHVFLHGLNRAEVFPSLVAPETDEALSNLEQTPCKALGKKMQTYLTIKKLGI